MLKLPAILKRVITLLLWWPCRIARASRGYLSPQQAGDIDAPRILIVACHWIGDTLWAAQVVPHLKRRWPEAYIAAITKSFSFPIWSGDLAVNEIIKGDAVTSDRRRERVNCQKLQKLAKLQRPQKWDIVIDLTGNRYSAIFCHLLHARFTLGFDGGEFGSLYSARVADAELPGKHLSQRPLRVTEPLLGPIHNAETILPPEPRFSFSQACENYELSPARPVAVFACGAGWREKCWPAKKFAQAAILLLHERWQVVLTGGPDEIELSREVMGHIGRQFDSSVRLIHEDTITPILGVLSGAAGFLGNDSGLGHLAASMGVPVIAIFTSQTNPANCRPLGEKAHYVLASSENALPEKIAQALLREAYRVN